MTALVLFFSFSLCLFVCGFRSGVEATFLGITAVL